MALSLSPCTACIFDFLALPCAEESLLSTECTLLVSIVLLLDVLIMDFNPQNGSSVIYSNDQENDTCAMLGFV